MTLYHNSKLKSIVLRDHRMMKKGNPIVTLLVSHLITYTA